MKQNKSKVSPTLNNENVDCDPSPNIFVNYLPKEYTKKELVQLFNQFGRIQSAKVMINLSTGMSKCYGFVRFESIHSAQRAILALNGAVIPHYNKTLLVKFAGSKMENIGSITNSIYVKSLCLHYSIKDIWNIFSKFGQVKGIELITDQKTNLFNGNAIITYSSAYEAQEAIRIMNNVKLTSESWPLFIQYSQKSAKNQILDSDRASFLNGIKIVKPKSSSSFESMKEANLLNSNQLLPLNTSKGIATEYFQKHDQVSEMDMITGIKFKASPRENTEFNLDEIWAKNNNNENINSDEIQSNMMFSLIAEEL